MREPLNPQNVSCYIYHFPGLDNSDIWQPGAGASFEIECDLETLMSAVGNAIRRDPSTKYADVGDNHILIRRRYFGLQYTFLLILINTIPRGSEAYQVSIYSMVYRGKVAIGTKSHTDKWRDAMLSNIFNMLS